MKLKDLSRKVIYNEDFAVEFATPIDNIGMLLNNTPSLTDVHQVKEWLANIRENHFDILIKWGTLQKLYTQHQLDIISSLDDADYKKFKQSSTLVENFCLSTFVYAEVYVQYRDILKMLLQISPEYNTMLSVLKTERL